MAGLFGNNFFGKIHLFIIDFKTEELNLDCLTVYFY